MKNLLVISLFFWTILISSNAFCSNNTKDSLKAEQLVLESLQEKNETQFKSKLNTLFSFERKNDIYTFFLAKYYLLTQAFQKAETVLNKGIKRLPENDIRSAKLYNSLGSVLSYQNKIPQGMKSYNKAITIYEKNKQISETAKIHSNIGNLYFTQLDYPSAEKHFKKSVAIFRKNKDTTYLGSVNAMYAMSLTKNGKFSLANKELDKAYFISKKYKNIVGIACCYLAKGEVFMDEKKYSEADEAFKLSLKLAEENRLGSFIVLNHISLNKLYNILKRFDEAIIHGETAISMIQSSTNLSPIAALSRNLSISYSGVNNFEKAYYYNNKALTLFRKINSEKNKKIINELNIKYETVKKEKAIAENKAKISKLTFVSIGSGLLFIVVLIIFYLNRIRNKERLYRIEEQKKLDVIAANLIGEEREKERVSYELHDSISASLTALRLKIETSEIEKEKLDGIISNLASIQDETRKISHNLLPFQGENSSFIRALENFCIENSSTIFEIKFHTSIEHIHISDIKAKTLYRIVQELVNNSMKHSQSSVCFVSINANSELLNILVEDQGIGLKEGRKNGQGLMSIAKRVANIDGNIEINSFENKGTSILIEISI